MAGSKTAKDTSILFAGNIYTAFVGFLLTILLARAISVEEMGVFSAFTNLMLLLGSVSDPGISAGLIKFIAQDGKENIKAKYISAALIIQLVIYSTIALLLLLFSNQVSKNLLATNNTFLIYILLIAILSQVLWTFSSYTLRARMKFVKSTVVDSITGTARFAAIFILIYTSTVNLLNSVFFYSITTLTSSLVGFYFLRNNFSFRAIPRKIYFSIIKFSGWLGVNKVASVLAGKIDIQMIALLVGAVSTGYYAIPSRLIFFVTVLVGSFSAVIAPRLASFNNHSKEKAYILKTLLFSLLIIFGLGIWFVIAEPFITILFGEKYIESVLIFRLLIISMVPFVLTTPSVNAIIYGMKKPGLVGYFSVFQLISVIILNFLFIPKHGAIGATYTLIIVNIFLAIYSWFFTVKHYFSK